MLLCFPACAAEQRELVEGEQYVRLKERGFSGGVKGKVEVREFFWYGCHHCYTLEPFVRSWLAKKPDYVTFIQTPAVLGKDWESHARAFYALRGLGKGGSFHQMLFDAIHKDRLRLRTSGEIADYFSAHGVPRERLRSAMKSLSVDLEIRSAQALAKRYRLRSVPVLVVGGKYMTAPNMLDCSGDLASCYQEFFGVVDALVEKAHKENPS